MSGQIPSYGKNFKHDHVGSWHPTLSDAIYILKIDNEWFIRADKSSKRWYIFHGPDRDKAINVSKVMPSMTKAMQLMLDGIKGGFYAVAEPDMNVHAYDCGLQGSGLDKYCTCHVENT